MTQPDRDDLAVKAILSMLWQALQPVHFQLGLIAGVGLMFVLLAWLS